MEQYVIAVLLFNPIYMISKSWFSFSMNIFDFIIALIYFPQCSILPFIEIVTHISFHESHNLHIYAFVFFLANIIFNRCVFDIVESLICHALFKHIDNAKQEGFLLLDSKSPTFKYLSFSAHKIQSHISSC